MLKVIDNEFNFIGAVDDFISFIPEKSYYGIGKFELHVDYSIENIEMLVEENIIFQDIDNAYIILHVENTSTDGKMVIKGLQLKQYLSRRITKPVGVAYDRKNTNAETIMKSYVASYANIPSLTIADDLGRGGVFVYQTRYKPLDEELSKLGKVSGLGWNISLDLENKQFVFDIIEGLDRTAGQSVNSNAIFSADFDNVTEQSFMQSKMSYANVAIVAGRGEGINRDIDIIGDATGFDRYEVFIDARDIEDISDLADRGLQELSAREKVLSFESDILTDSNLFYGVDFNIGDLVTIQNKKWNITLNTRIDSIKEIYEANGFKLEATFGNAVPSFLDIIKKKLDTPIAESSGTSGALINLDGGRPDTLYGDLPPIIGGGVVGS